MQAHQVREKPPKRGTGSFPQASNAHPISGRRCPFCSAVIQTEAIVCPSCGRSLKLEGAGLTGLKEALLFGAILLLVALVIAPVWPKEQIYGKSIQFLVQIGVMIPSSLDEATAFRQQMMNVVQLYQGLNLLHYFFISAFIFIYVIHIIRMSKQVPGYSERVWIVLGLLLLVFPVVNLALSWSMFFSPGVLVTALTSILVVFTGKFLK